MVGVFAAEELNRDVEKDFLPACCCDCCGAGCGFVPVGCCGCFSGPGGCGERRGDEDARWGDAACGCLSACWRGKLSGVAHEDALQQGHDGADWAEGCDARVHRGDPGCARAVYVRRRVVSL